MANYPLSTTATVGWLQIDAEEYEKSPDYIGEGLATDVVEDALAIMKREGISRAELARLMDVKPAYVTKILNAPPNMTLRSVAHLAITLGVRPVVRLESPAARSQTTVYVSWSNSMPIHRTQLAKNVAAAQLIAPGAPPWGQISTATDDYSLRMPALAGGRSRD